ncbi:hypothetical protein D9M72_328710 [compost metagenome]
MQELGLDEDALLAKLRPAAAIYFIMDERDVERIAQFPLTIFGSDGLRSIRARIRASGGPSRASWRAWCARTS